VASLADTLHFLRPDFAPTLVPSESLVSVGEIAERLPPLAMAGLEVRLGRGNDQVDLQVRVGPDLEEVLLLVAHIRDGVAAGRLPDHPVWRRLAKVCERWADNPSAIPALSEAWLEFDNDPRRRAPIGLPSIFFGLSAAVPLEDAFAQSLELLAGLQGRPLREVTASALRRCFDACPPGAFVSHVGVMLGRDTRELRVNLHRVRADEAVGCLRAAGWRSDERALSALLVRLYGLVDHVRLCVSVSNEVDDRVGDRLGLEAFYRNPRGLDPRWRGLLEALGRMGLCDPAKADALLAWPATVTPASSQASWPDHLVVRSLTRTDGAFSAIERRLGHVKIDYRDGHLPGAKVYLGWVHEWVKGREPVRADGVSGAPVITRQARRPAPGRSAPSRRECDAAVDAATGFLLDARSQGGWWLDFTQVKGGSDEWVTAYVATALADVPDEAGRRAARWAWSLLNARRPEASGWGGGVPPDTDSTVWAVRLAHALGLERTDRAERAEAFVLRHWQSGGGFATYLDGPIRTWAGCGPEASVGGWTSSHVCVTAAAAGVPAFAPRALDWLRRMQQPDGHWIGYWWPDPLYTTTLAAEAFARHGRPEDRHRVEAAVRWTLARIAPAGDRSAQPSVERSAFALAWVVRALLLSSDMQAVRDPLASAVRWLLAHQDEGAWPASARFRLPSIERQDPEKDGHSPVHLDDRGVFTAATVLTALRRVQASGIFR
jgi:hypothetical protein